ncbi:hypothetical protein MA16_Dca028222 [Dendrobium catenatum]|uniref:Uncharacterized protein n=1 Tax=Dendrobium catenatum TaxID=906689 RepID=A0A2I0V9A9_9ASPA|nr:hypothetical protein MA16_Dca028222 [Dendrobium catenatum]
MDCGRRSAVDDDRSRKTRLAVDDDRRQGRWAVDDARSRIAFYQAQSKKSLDQVDRNLDRIRETHRRHPSHHTPTVADDYAPLELPLKWRDPPPEYIPLELPLRWRDPPPLHCQIRVPEPPFPSIPTTAVDSNHRSRRTDANDVPKTSPLIPPSEPTPPPSLPLSPPDLTLKVDSVACVQDGLPRPDSATASSTSSDPTHLPSSGPSDPPTSPSPPAPDSLSLQLAIGLDAEIDAAEEGLDLRRSIMNSGNLGGNSTPSYHSKSSIHEIDLLPDDATQDLLGISNRMIVTGYDREYFQVYGSVLKSAMELCLRHMGIERLSIGNVQRLDWVALGNQPLQDLIFRLQIHQQQEEIQEFHVPLNHEHKGLSIQNEILPASFGGTTASSNIATLQGMVFPSIAQNHALFLSVQEAAQLLRTRKEIHISRVGTLVWNNNILTIGGIGDVSLTGVQMLDEKSIDKINPTPCSQAARRNVATDFGQLVVDDFIAEIVEGDRFTVQVLHLLESTKQEPQHELYKACEAVSLPRDDLLGRGKVKELVMPWLRKPSNEHPGTDLYRNIFLLAIVGHGVGQSTLLQLVYEYEMIKEIDLKKWVSGFSNFADMLKSLKMRIYPLDTLYALQRILNLK